MNVRSSRKLWLSLGITLVLLALVWVVSTAVAQEPDGRSPLSPAGGSYANTFTYQGRLLDGGQPANGIYDFIVTIWDSSIPMANQVATCLTTTTESILIEDGIFTLYLVPDQPMNEVFSGQERWIEIAVSPAGANTYTTLDRQPIAPTPYAWGLRPGAIISGTATSYDFGGAVVNIDNNMPSWYNLPALYVRSSSGSAVRGESEGTGIYGQSTWSYAIRGDTITGTAGYFTSDVGYGVQGASYGNAGVVASSGFGRLIEGWDTDPINDLRFYVENNGSIYSAAETQLAINPFEIEATSELANNLTLSFLHHWLGYTEVENDSNTGSSTIYVPVHNLTHILGSSLKLKALKVCYEVDTPSSYISQTRVYYANDSGGRTEILTDHTDRTSTSWTCYTASNVTPVATNGPMLVYFNLYFAGTGSGHTITIGQITATLVE